MSNPKPIDVSFSEVPDNLVGFPQPDSNVAQQPSEQPTATTLYTSQQLSEVAGVSRQSWGKDWFKHFEKVAPVSDLKQGRQYTHLAYELTCSLRQARDQQWPTGEWLDVIAIPTWGRTPQEFQQAAVSEAVTSGALVPQSITQASTAQGEGLALARDVASMARGLLDEVVLAIDSADQESRQQAEAIEEQTMTARATVKVLKQRRIQAEVEAQAAAKQQELENQRLRDELARLKGEL